MQPGLAGSGLGYEGIFNALSVELDTYHNFENMVSVHIIQLFVFNFIFILTYAHLFTHTEVF